MMSELTHVVSSTGLDDEPEAAVSEVCPRELIGLSCLIGDAYTCLCEHVSGCSIETVKNQKGQAAVVNLTLNLIPMIGEAKSVMTGIDLTGYKAEFKVSNQAVGASFTLARGQNRPLALFLAQTGL